MGFNTFLITNAHIVAIQDSRLPVFKLIICTHTVPLYIRLTHLVKPFFYMYYVMQQTIDFHRSDYVKI